MTLQVQTFKHELTRDDCLVSETHKGWMLDIYLFDSISPNALHSVRTENRLFVS